MVLWIGNYHAYASEIRYEWFDSLPCLIHSMIYLNTPFVNRKSTSSHQRSTNALHFPKSQRAANCRSRPVRVEATLSNMASKYIQTNAKNLLTVDAEAMTTNLNRIINAVEFAQAVDNLFHTCIANDWYFHNLKGKLSRCKVHFMSNVDFSLLLFSNG